MKSLFVVLSLAVVALAEPPLGPPFTVYGPPANPSVSKLTTVVQLPAASGEKYFPAGTTGFNSPPADIPTLLPASKRVEIIVKPGSDGFKSSYPTGGLTVPQPSVSGGGSPAGTFLIKSEGAGLHPYPAVKTSVPAIVYGVPTTPAPTPKIHYPYAPAVVYGPPAAPAPAPKIHYNYPPAVPAIVYGAPTTPAPTPKIHYPYAPAVVYGPPPTPKIHHPYPAAVTPKISYVAPKITYVTPKPLPIPDKPYAPAVVYGPPTTHAPVPTIKINYPYPPAVPAIKVVKPAVVYGPPIHTGPTVAPKITYVTPKPVPSIPAVVYGPPVTHAKISYPYAPAVPTIKVVPPTTIYKPAVVYGPPVTPSGIAPKITYITPKPEHIPTTPKSVVPSLVYGVPSIKIAHYPAQVFPYAPAVTSAPKTIGPYAPASYPYAAAL